MSMQHSGYICENGKTQGKLNTLVSVSTAGRKEGSEYKHTLVPPRVSRDDTN